MISGGVEMALGMVRDPKFGPLVMCGLGGVFIEVVRDIAFRLPPVTREDAHEMLQSLKGYKLLNGYRGAPPCDLNPLLDALVTISHLTTGMPMIHELDINPFLITPTAATSCAIDARIILSDTP
jgi:acetyltransferase